MALQWGSQWQCYVRSGKGAASQGLDRAEQNGIAVLLDLPLPDSEGVATFDKLFAASPDVSILILPETVEPYLVCYRIYSCDEVSWARRIRRAERIAQEKKKESR
jgi:DNA-binding NarL/FixJ family response regulator